MNQNIFTHVKHFFHSNFNIDEALIIPYAQIERDFGFYGDDIDDIFLRLSKEFNVDFNILDKRHEFSPEGLGIISYLIKWIHPSPKLNDVPKQKDMSIHELVDIIEKLQIRES